MAQDLVYYFDKTAPYDRHELGEIQTDFNMSIVIDGTKDSLQIEVYSFVGDVLTPNTIIYHSATQTWWCVKRDSVKRYASERGNYYHHNLTLNGAIDLLGSRDLTDCGFNDNTYNIRTFLIRLFSLSNFEYDVSFNYGNNVDEYALVNYIKTYENYTLLSALREFLNGYNCDAKMSFITNAQNQITGAVIKIISKTGDIDLPQLSIDVFDDIRENKDINKESYATSVISNANNVTSTLSKTYPEIGGVRLIADNKYKVDNFNDEPYLKLPTPAWKVNWVKAISPIRLYFTGTTELFYPQNDSDFEEKFAIILGQAHEDEREEIIRKKEIIRNMCIGCSQITFPSGFDYNVLSNKKKWTKWDTTPYLPYLYYHTAGADNNYATTMVLADKQTYETIKDKQLHGLYWERGSDMIKGFETFYEISISDYFYEKYNRSTIYPTRTDLVLFGLNQNYIKINSGRQYEVWAFYEDDDLHGTEISKMPMNKIGLKDTVWQVNYIPMSEMKIKYDNNNKTKDIKLYNQNGKLNESLALSKLIDSYSKEIENETITRYMHYNSFSSIPQIGQIVDNNGKKYSISNISYDFLINESSDSSLNYYIECQFTLSPFVATKSLMVNPNSNIRDYGIPQKYNVKRKQLYRDYYNFTYDPLTSDSGRYVDIDKYTTFGESPQNYDHTAIIKIDYAQAIGGKTSWYYQLSTTSYILEKSIYEIVDFNDNNIIGIDIQNWKSGFNMNNIWKNERWNIQTPVSYVDYDGKAQSFHLAMVNKTNLDALYNAVYTYTNVPKSTPLSCHCFVSPLMYEGLRSAIDGNETSTRQEPLALESNALVFNDIPVTTCVFSFNVQTFLENRGIDIDFSQDTEINITLNSASIYGGSSLPNAEIYDLEIIGTDAYITIVDKTTQHFSSTLATQFLDISLKVEYEGWGYTVVFNGAKDSCDYLIEDINYNKDAIEVPVFEYSLQVADTPEIESGNKLIQYSKDDISYCYGYAIVDKNKATQLNALKYADQTIGHNVDISPLGVKDVWSLINGVSCSFIKTDGVSTGVRLCFCGQYKAFYNNTTGVFGNELYNIKNQTWALENIVGKDLVIYRYAIRKDDGSAYDKQVMFILHNVPQSAFKTPVVNDNSNLEFAVNHRKLK